MVKISNNFTRSELACPCCGAYYMDPNMVDALQAIRDQVGEPIYVSSACRCKKHNKDVGGVSNSQHLCDPCHGRHTTAVDIRCRGLSAPSLALVAAGVFDVAKGGIGLYWQEYGSGYVARWGYWLWREVVNGETVTKRKRIRFSDAVLMFERGKE